MRKIFTFLLGLLSFGVSHSQVLFVDHFEYGTNPGAIISLTGSPWVANTSGGTTNPIQYDPGSSLVFGTYPTFGGKVKLIPNGQDITAPLSPALQPIVYMHACLLTFLLHKRLAITSVILCPIPLPTAISPGCL